MVENLEVLNIDGALRGMRNPLKSWDKSDSNWEQRVIQGVPGPTIYAIGDNDAKLANRLIRAGSDHRKFLRQILVSMDITGSMSFWWDIDTYCVGVAKNSTSRMHSIFSNDFEFRPKDFNWELPLSTWRMDALEHYNNLLMRLQFNLMQNGSVYNNDDVTCELFEELINDLPQGQLFKRTWTGNFEVLLKIYKARKNHKQKEIRDFCKELKEKVAYTDKIKIFE